MKNVKVSKGYGFKSHVHHTFGEVHEGSTEALGATKSKKKDGHVSGNASHYGHRSLGDKGKVS